MFRCTTSPYGSKRGCSCSSVASRGTCSTHSSLGTNQRSVGIGGHSQACAGLSVKPNLKDEKHQHWLPVALGHRAASDVQPTTCNEQMLPDGLYLLPL